jgi:NADH-quinone oxidoreductase subunit N
MNNVLPNFLPIMPEIFLMSMACVILLITAFTDDTKRVWAYWLTQASLVVAAWLTLRGSTGSTVYTFHNMFVQDSMADTLKLALYAILFVVFIYSRDYLKDRNMLRGEYFVLGLFGLIGMMVMVSAASMLTIYLGLELLSLSLYAMVALNRDSLRSTEAAMKYFVLGAIASGMLLYGISMIYGITGSLELQQIRASITGLGPDNLILVFGLVFIIVGLAFKLGAVPFHMWIPDVYEGAPTAVVMYVSSAPKLAAFAMIMRVLVGGLEPMSHSWQEMLIILSVLSMGLGNVIAIAQTNMKRMLAYSTISHMGFFLLGIISNSGNGYSSAMFYVLVYAGMSMGVFGMLTLMSSKGTEVEEIKDLQGLSQKHPWLAGLMLIFMISMAGVPPTLGFYAKLLVIQSVIEADMLWLAIVSVLMAVIGAFYYLRIVKVMYFDSPSEGSAQSFQVLPGGLGLVSLNAVALIVMLFFVGWLIELCRHAIAGLL